MEAKLICILCMKSKASERKKEEEEEMALSGQSRDIKDGNVKLLSLHKSHKVYFMHPNQHFCIYMS